MCKIVRGASFSKYNVSVISNVSVNSKVSLNLTVSVVHTEFGIDSSVSGPSEWQEVKVRCITKVRVREASAGTMEREKESRVSLKCPERTRAHSRDGANVK